MKGQSVTDLKSFTKQVMPALARHQNTLCVLYASGMVKAYEVDPETVRAEQLFKRIAPSIAKKAEKAEEGDSADDDEEEE